MTAAATARVTGWFRLARRGAGRRAAARRWHPRTTRGAVGTLVLPLIICAAPPAWSGTDARRPWEVPAPPPTAAAAPAFVWPLAGAPRMVRGFDPPPRPWLPGHRGVDLAAAPDASVRSAGSGVVLFAGHVAGRPVITVGHSDGLRTTYEPVRPTVRPGTRVTAGTPLGALLAGHPGCPAPACLHWGLRRGEEYLDPLALLGPVPVRLLPLTDQPSVPSALLQQRRQSSREPLVLLRRVVDLGAEP